MARFDTNFPYSKLRKGKFRDASYFLLKDGDTSGGRKTVTHEYPNSDKRYVEDMGASKETYNLELYADTTTNFSQRDKIKKALNEEGTGKLIHPFFGQKTVSVKGWTLFNDFGWSRFNVTFEESDPAVLPSKETGNKSLLDRLKEALKSQQETKVGEVFNAVNSGFKTFTKGVEKVQDFSEQMLEVANEALNVASELSSFTNTINDTLDNTALLIKTPSELGARISNLFTQFELIGERTIDQFNLLKGMFGFGNDDTDTKTNTENQKLIIQNNNTLNTAIRTNALASAYVIAVDIDFRNNLELEETRKILEEEYQSLILIVDDDTLDSLTNLRSNAGIVFEKLSITVPKIYTINLVSTQNIHQLVYNYYGNFANFTDFENKVEEIYLLNNFSNPSKIRGEVKLLA